MCDYRTESSGSIQAHCDGRRKEYNQGGAEVREAQRRPELHDLAGARLLGTARIVGAAAAVDDLSAEHAHRAVAGGGAPLRLHTAEARVSRHRRSAALLSAAGNPELRGVARGPAALTSDADLRRAGAVTGRRTRPRQALPTPAAGPSACGAVPAPQAAPGGCRRSCLLRPARTRAAASDFSCRRCPAGPRGRRDTG